MRFKFNTCLVSTFMFALFFSIFGQTHLYGQTHIYANTVTSHDHTINSENAADADLQTKAIIKANSGTAFGIGGYSGQLELKFPTPVSANTTAYVKIDADDNLFPALLGGNLGNLIDDVLGNVLIGNQEFSIQVLNGSTELLSANSQTNGNFAKPNIRLVVNAVNEYFIAVTPNQIYDRIKITNRIGSLLGLNNTKRLNIYGAFYNSTPNDCGQAAYTSYDGNGLNLDALNIGGVGVTHPENAIDTNPDNFSELSMGILSGAGSISQTLYFKGLSNTNDNFNIRLKLDPSLLTAGVANSIYIIAKNGANEVANVSLSSLLNVDLLTLLQGNRVAVIPFSPGVKIDRITIKYVSLLNVNLTQRLDFYGIERLLELPKVASVNLDQTACVGATASLFASTIDPSLELRWYEEIESKNPFAIHGTGEAFITPKILGDITYYVAAGKSGCTLESERVAVHIKALATPSSNDITIRGNDGPFCSSSKVVLKPESSEKGIFSWYFDANKISKIFDGLSQNGITYSIESNGTLSITGLSEINAPSNYYVELTNDKGCSNVPGDLKSVSVSILEGNLVPIITLSEKTTADDTISEDEHTEIIMISGSVSGDAQIGDDVSLFINNKTYTGIVKDNYTFEIGVEGSDLSEDEDHTIEALLETTNGTCFSTATDTDSYLVNFTTLTVPTVTAQQTNDNTPIVTGTADSDDNLTVRVNGINYTENDGDLVDHGDGTWSLTIPDANALPEGTYDVDVTVTDNDGHNAHDATTDELVIDANAVVLTVPTVNAQQTNDTTPIVTGTADSDDNLTVRVNGINYTKNDGNLVDHGDGTWSLTIPDANALPEGTYDVDVTVTDNDGHNAHDATTDELVIDANAVVLTVPTVNAQQTNDTTPIVTGTADSDDNLTVRVNGINYTENDGDLVDHGDDTWSLTIPDANALPEGSYDVAVTVTDNDGHNAHDATTDELVIDANAVVLTVPTVTAQQTNDTTPIVTGTADSDDNLTVRVNGINYTENDGDLVDHGDDTWSLTIPDANALPEGTYDVDVTVTDNDGHNAHDATTDELVIDANAVVLTVPTVTAQQTNDTTPIVTGTADSDDNLTVRVNGINYTENDGDLVDHGDDTWSLTIPDANALPEGTYDVAVTVTDNDGHNAHDATTDELVIDANAVVLTVPTVTAQQTNDTTPIVTGTADSDDNLTVRVNGINYTENDGDLVDHGDDTWSLTIPDANALPEGTYDVAVTVTDNDGHSANDATTDEISIEAATSDLTITKTVDRLNPLIGETIVYTITVQNTGETDFNEIIVDEQIRDGFTYINSTVSAGEYDSSQGIWTISNLAINESATLMVTVKVNAYGDTTNTANIISSDPEETDIENNSDTVTITRSCLTIYNEFSPNNDGANDTFKIKCIEQYPSNTLKIFNRYGSLVYSASSYKNNWNGIANVSGVVRKGEVLPSGTYFYVLKIKDFDNELTGWLFLAR